MIQGYMDLFLPTTTLNQSSSNRGYAFSLGFRAFALDCRRASLRAFRVPPKPSESDELSAGSGSALALLLAALVSPVGSWKAAYSLASTS